MQRGLPPSEEQLGETSRLKQQPGKKIGIGGSTTLVRSLLEDDLLDKLQL
jgi:dihydrofolate reductase